MTRPRGVSLVELMIGLALGLFIVAATLTAVTAQLDDQRRLLMATQVEQDLRAAADLIARDLRRSGYWHDAARQLSANGGTPNAYTALSAGDATQPSTNVGYAYSQDAAGADNDVVDANDQTGAKLDSGAIKLLSGGSWQPLTDPDTITVTGFQVVQSTQSIPLAAYCALPCPSGAAACPPVQLLRSVTIAIEAHATHDSSIARSLRTTVRLRNDGIVGACAA